MRSLGSRLASSVKFVVMRLLGKGNGDWKPLQDGARIRPEPIRPGAMLRCSDFGAILLLRRHNARSSMFRFRLSFEAAQKSLP
jgi:hypothetical protein